MKLIKTIKHLSIAEQLYNVINPFAGTILMLHRVVEHQSLINDNRKLEITVDFLEQTIVKYINKGCCFVDIDEVYNLKYQTNKSRCPYICFTFDDGFRDNLTLALPVFEKYQIPFTVYVATGFPDQTIFVWWYWLEILVMSVNKLLLLSGKSIVCNLIADKNDAFMLLKQQLLLMSNENCRIFIEQMFEKNGLEMIAQIPLLSWDDIRLLNSHPLCTIGSHGVSHTSLVVLDDQMLDWELISSKKKLEHETGKVIKHFAYPYGYYNKAVIKAVKKAGYQTAVQIDGGMQRRHQPEYNFKRTILIQ